MRCLVSLFLLLAAAFPGIAGEVEITDSTDEAMDAFRVETPAAVYYYQKEAGGFSSILDPEGADWIGYSNSGNPEYPASAASDYRGLPNLVFRGEDDGAGHPGFGACRSFQTGTDTIRTESKSGRWAWEWKFNDSLARMDILRFDPSREYWFLYEGIPGGRYAPSQQYWGTDQGGPRRDTPDYLAGQEVYGNWRWAYFGDSSSEKVFFLVSLRAEPEVSEMGYLGGDRNGLEAEDGMVVFGIGREKGAVPLLEGKNSFVVGFYPERIETPEEHAEIKAYLDSFLNPGAAPSGD